MARVENPDFSKVHCWECDKLVETYYVTFFLDEGGLPRHGSVCSECRPIVKDRKIIVLSDPPLKPTDVAKKMADSFKNSMNK
jgi:hypothetical protein